jgi:hypothetical protein
MRPPSLGFVYLVVAIGVFFAFFAYLRATPWWEKSGAERELAEIAYLERIAAKGTDAQRSDWLNEALRLAVNQQAWEDALRILHSCWRENVAADPGRLVEIEPGRVFALGFDPDRRTRRDASSLLVMRNPGAAPLTVHTYWRATRGADARLRPIGEEWRTIRVLDSSTTEERFTVPAASTLAVEVVATETIRLERVVVTS